MSDWDDVPVFGDRRAGMVPVHRPSAYGLVTDAHGRLAIVSTPRGVFLPGGGIHSGETPETAVCRETVEECGIHVALGGWRRRAIQLAFSEVEAVYFEKRSMFMNAV